MSKGAVQDFELFKRNLHLVPTNSFILADKGYQGIYAIYPNSLLPCKAKKRCELDPLLKHIIEKLIKEEESLNMYLVH